MVGEGVGVVGVGVGVVGEGVGAVGVGVGVVGDGGRTVMVYASLTSLLAMFTTVPLW